MIDKYTNFILRWRWFVATGMFLLAFAIGSGAKHLGFDSDYHVFFSSDDENVINFDALQRIYAENDNVLFVVEPQGGKVFDKKVLTAIQELTDRAWRLPFATRVDSITNFQYTHANEDELIVENLVDDVETLSSADLDKKREIAVNEPLLINRLISKDAHVTGVNATIQLANKDPMEVQDLAVKARELAKEITDKYPNLKIYLTGVKMLNNAFPEASQQDMMTLVPLMYGILLITMLITLRSVTGTIATLLTILMSMVIGMGFAGWVRTGLTPPSASAPTIILTLAIADSIHILTSILQAMRRGTEKYEAIRESLRHNMLPVFITSISTVIGFASMNLNDVRPFRDLGNITAVGITAAWIYSITFLPAFMAILPVRVKVASESDQESMMERLGGFVVAKRLPLMTAMALVIVFLSSMVPRLEINDQFVQYFDEEVDFRRDSDFAMKHLTGVYQVEYSLRSGESGGISNPEYLAKVEEFAKWFRKQPEVVHVNSITDIFKRLNKNMHGDDPAYYRLPEKRDLAAQYLLLYEMSLPYRLDLNNQINVDKSSTRFTVSLKDVSTSQMKSLEKRGREWLQNNAPEYMMAVGTSPTVMFSHISDKNVKSMLSSGIVAVVLISFILVIALKSVTLGILSLIPNLMPLSMAFGVWALWKGEVGLAAATVSAMPFGIVVDDTVHFLSKYLLARREKGLTAEQAVKYAFSSVGMALWITSIVLIAGFAILTQSTFKLNSDMGSLTTLIIVFALAADFFFLPPILLYLDKKKHIKKEIAISEPATQG